jgi:hypothetical protein
MAYMHARLQASADNQPMTVGCLLCPDWPGHTGTAEEARAASEAHREERHPELVGRKVVRKRRVFSHAMSAEREAQIDEERRQRMRMLGIS